MSNFTFENQGVNTYLVYEIPENSQVDSLAMGMLTNNNISGIANTIFTQMNATQYIKFNISSKVSVNQLFSGAVNSKRLINVFLGIVDTMITLEEYMLDYKMLVLDLDHIYVNVATEDVTMIYLPVLDDNSASIDAGQFFRNIVFGGIQFDQNEKSNYVTQLINYLSNTASFSILEFKNLLADIKSSTQKHSKTDSRKGNSDNGVGVKSIDSEIMDFNPEKNNSNVTPNDTPKVVPIDNGPGTTWEEVQRKAGITPVPEEKKEEKKKSLFGIFHHEKKEKAIDKTPQKKNKTSSASAGFAIPGQEDPIVSSSTGVATEENNSSDNISPAVTTENSRKIIETHVDYSSDFDQDLTVYDDFNDDEGTVVMDERTDAQRINPYLFRAKTKEKIIINKAIFKIGRNSDFNDYNIRENKHIGHSHCHIVVSNGEYYVVDDNSKNHTYIDNKMIPAGTEAPITHGQILRLANEEFEFRLY